MLNATQSLCREQALAQSTNTLAFKGVSNILVFFRDSTYLGGVDDGAIVVGRTGELEYSTVGGGRYATVPARACRYGGAVSHLARNQGRKCSRRSDEYSVLCHGQYSSWNRACSLENVAWMQVLYRSLSGSVKILI